METTRELELSRLSDVVAESMLSIEELAALPAHVGAASGRDCVYDGSLIGVSHRLPVLADGGELVLDILGPYWDRVFRIRFFGVSAVTLDGFGPSLSTDVRELVLTAHDDVKRCEVRGLSFPIVLAVNYAYATVSRRQLASPLERAERGS